MASDSFQYRAIFEYKRERGDDINLQTGDLLTVPKASLMAAEGGERSPKGWLHGTNERTKEQGDFPGTFVEYVGVVRVGLPVAKSWPRAVPATPGGQQTAAGPQPPGAATASVFELQDRNKSHLKTYMTFNIVHTCAGVKRKLNEESGIIMCLDGEAASSILKPMSSGSSRSVSELPH
ncbi:unnamed protein product [Pleuronectes platessa]|uniref:SH3 domain-containing protein n=1 Tax=Pleuronectes platessa TaxID=8262 RepID=A0A9N7YBZ0_PLEPL|nr:unnamed protein product [Pleuronectes platessa]